MKNNMVGWFEIPVKNIQRAKTFYDTVFGIDIKIQDFGVLKMGWFPTAEGKSGASGSLMQHEAYKSSKDKGVLIYFSTEDITTEINKVEAAGGKIVQVKTQISPDIGYMAIFIDCEGNRIALHSKA